MGVQIPVGFGQMNLLWQIGGAIEPFQVTIGYDGDVAEDPNVDADEINTIMIASGRPAKNSEFSNAYTWVGVNVTRMTSTGPITGSKGTSVPGTKSAPPVPPNTAILMRKATARGGRMGRGRCFLPPIWTDESNVSAQGTITAFDLAGIQALWDSAYTALSGSDCPPVLLHADGSTPDPITSFQLQTTVATQRRRLRR